MACLLPEKKTLRREFMGKRDLLSDDERAGAAKNIERALSGLDAFTDSSRVLLYASYGSELPTDGIFDLCAGLGKRVYYPKVRGKEMQFYRIDSLSELKEGFHGIREPIGDSEEDTYDNGENDLMIMPGVAFDKEGNRLGYGGGYYDRFLAKWPALAKKSVAIGYKMQETVHIPTESNDIKPGMILLV